MRDFKESKAIYNKWLKSEVLTESEKKQLKILTQGEVLDAFSEDLAFGTAGIRGIMGLGTNKLNLLTLNKITLGLVSYLKAHQLSSCIIGYDNRHNSKTFAEFTSKVLLANQIKVYLFEHLRPTPFVSFAIRYFNASCGVMITASHNPKNYNGFKVYNATGGQLIEKESDELLTHINKIKDYFKLPITEKVVTYIKDDFDEIYFDLLKTIKINGTTTPLKVVYSPLHGTGATVIPKFLARFGHTIYPVSDQMVNDPNFSATLSTNPEDPKSFALALETAKTLEADIVLLTDPDADRLGVGVLHKGRYLLLNGNQTPAIILNYLLSQKKHETSLVISTIVSSPIMQKIAQHYQMFYQETLTGFKHMADIIEQYENIYPFGFASEESFGCLVSDFVRDKDAIQATTIICEIASILKENDLTLLDYLDTIYQQFCYHVETTVNLALDQLADDVDAAKIMNLFKKTKNVLNGPLIAKIDYNKAIKVNELYLPKSNVIKFIGAKEWVVLRPSGTEPKLKIYFGTIDENRQIADDLLAKLKHSVLAKINDL